MRQKLSLCLPWGRMGISWAFQTVWLPFRLVDPERPELSSQNDPNSHMRPNPGAVCHTCKFWFQICVWRWRIRDVSGQGVWLWYRWSSGVGSEITRPDRGLTLQGGVENKTGKTSKKGAKEATS